MSNNADHPGTISLNENGRNLRSEHQRRLNERTLPEGSLPEGTLPEGASSLINRPSQYFAPTFICTGFPDTCI